MAVGLGHAVHLGGGCWDKPPEGPVQGILKKNSSELLNFQVHLSGSLGKTPKETCLTETESNYHYCHHLLLWLMTMTLVQCDLADVESTG